MKQHHVFHRFSRYCCIAGVVLLAGNARGADVKPSIDKPAPVAASPQQSMTYEEMLKRYDLNKDGKLDEPEIAAAQAQFKTVRPAFAKTSLPAQKITRQDLMKGNGKTTSSGSGDDFIKRYDLNHDGELDAAELEAAKADIAKGQTKTPTASAPKSRVPVKSTSVKPAPLKPGKQNSLIR